MEQITIGIIWSNELVFIMKFGMDTRSVLCTNFFMRIGNYSFYFRGIFLASMALRASEAVPFFLREDELY